MRRGKEYITFDNIQLELRFGKTNLVFEDIFRGNQELTDRTNQLISENIQDIITEIKPVIDGTIGNFVLSLVHDVFARYSVDDLFPKN